MSKWTLESAHYNCVTCCWTNSRSSSRLIVTGAGCLQPQAFANWFSWYLNADLVRRSAFCLGSDLVLPLMALYYQLSAVTVAGHVDPWTGEATNRVRATTIKVPGAK